MNKRRKKQLFITFQIIVSLLLLYFVFHKINILQILTVFLSINYTYLFSAFLVFVILLQLFFVARWYTILKFNKIDVSFIKLVKYHYISSIFQMILPTGVGSDAAKAVMLFHKGDKVKSINSTFIARGVGIVVLLILSSVGSLFLKTENFQKLKILLWGSTFFVIIIFIMLFIPRINLFLRKAKWLNKVGVVSKIINNLLDNMNVKMLLSLFILSLFIQLLTIMSMFFVFLAIDIHISIIKLLIFVPLIVIFTIMIPSVAGIGTREYFLWYFFKAELVTKESLAAFSIINYSLLLIVVLIGILFWFYSLIKNHKLL